MPPRTWTEASAAAWKKQRNERRALQGDPPIESLSSSKRTLALEKERRELLEDETARLKTQAWSVGTHPILSSNIVPVDASLELPRAHRLSGNADLVKVERGADAGVITHSHYMQRADLKVYTTLNYVSHDGLAAVRHEYLGPDPRVAAYRVVHNRILIEWYDAFLDLFWIGGRTWAPEVEFDVIVEGWFVKERHEY